MRQFSELAAVSKLCLQLNAGTSVDHSSVFATSVLERVAWELLQSTVSVFQVLFVVGY
jgi:hypothetical protein